MIIMQTATPAILTMPRSLVLLAVPQDIAHLKDQIKKETDPVLIRDLQHQLLKKYVRAISRGEKGKLDRLDNDAIDLASEVLKEDFDVLRELDVRLRNLKTSTLADAEVVRSELFEDISKSAPAAAAWATEVVNTLVQPMISKIMPLEELARKRKTRAKAFKDADMAIAGQNSAEMAFGAEKQALNLLKGVDNLKADASRVNVRAEHLLNEMNKMKESRAMFNQRMNDGP